MDKGNKISYAIFKEVSRFSFYEWLKEWDIEEADWDKFIKAGVEIFNNEDSEEINHRSNMVGNTKNKTREARWIINSDGYYPYCSACMTEPQNGEMADYCPNCGAKMKK